MSDAAFIVSDAHNGHTPQNEYGFEFVSTTQLITLLIDVNRALGALDQKGEYNIHLDILDDMIACTLINERGFSDSDVGDLYRSMFDKFPVVPAMFMYYSTNH